MKNDFVGNKHFYALIAPHLTLAWRLLLSFGLIWLALIISS